MTAPGKTPPQTPPRGATVNAWIGQAKEAISKANYAAALELLGKAVAVAPEDAEARQLLAQTEAASRRHQAAVARYQQVVETARQIAALVDRGELATARTQLTAATQQLGQQDAFADVENRLQAAEAEASRQRAAQLASDAQTLLAANDWQGALAAARESLSLQPNDEVRALAEKARAELEHRAEQYHVQQAVKEAQQDVERLIEARELARAGQRLRQAIDTLGNLATFVELERRLDKSKSDLSFRQRVEWAERRANEAESLIAEAGLLSRRNAFTDAVERLEAARQLDPSHPDLDQHLATARTALEQQTAERQRVEAIAARRSDVRSHLDALRLDAAAEAIRDASQEFGEPQHFAAERTRLERLRSAERSARDPLPGAQLDSAAEAELLRRQRSLAAAYSWKQALLYPFRGLGSVALWSLFGALLACDLLAHLLGGVPFAGRLPGLLKLGVLAAVVAAMPALVRDTLNGRNLLPPWGELSDLRSRARDLLQFGGLLLLASLPLLLILLTRPWHGGLKPDSGPISWLLAAAGAWLGIALVVLVGGAAIAFGNRQIPRLAQHVRALAQGRPESLLTLDGLFAAGLVILVIRTALAPNLPWLGLPLAQLLTAYLLILAPHLMGILIRRHRVELSKIYS
ncbi:MAG: hypothetical protein AAF560_13120 [Acidobacteriota bacterium]